MWRKLTDLFSCVGVMSSICHERDPILSRTSPGFPTVHCCTAFTDCKYLYISYLFISHHKQQQWHLGLVRRLKYALNCFVSLNSSEWAALSLQSWACLVCTPAVLPYCSTKEIIISGTADIQYMCCNPCSLDIVMPFITEQTKCLSLLYITQGVYLEKTPQDDGIAFIAATLHQVSSVAERPFLIMSFSHEVFSCYYPYYWDISFIDL